MPLGGRILIDGGAIQSGGGGTEISASAAASYQSSLAVTGSRAATYGGRLQVSRSIAASYGAGGTAEGLSATAQASYGAGLLIERAGAGSYGAGLALPVAPLSGYTRLSDVAEMADGSVWLGRYDRNGVAAPLLWVNSYTQSYVGLCGDRAVYETTAQVTEQAGAATGRGVLSLHPDGYALAETQAGNLQLWRYAAGAWSVLTETGAEEVPEAIGAVTVGTYRVEVISGTVYIMPRAGQARRGYRLTGSVLTPLQTADSAAEKALPLAARQYLQATRANTLPAYSYNYPRSVYWRSRWHWQDGESLHRLDDEAWSIGFLQTGGTWNVQGALTVIGFNDQTYGIGAAPTAGDTAAAALSYYGNRLQLRPLDMFPLAGRETGGVLWTLGMDAADMWANRAAMVGPGGATPEFEKFNWLGTSLRLYSIGRPDPAVGVVVTDCPDDEYNGYYEVVPDVVHDGRDVYVSDDGEHLIVWDGDTGHWIIVDNPGVVVSNSPDPTCDGTYVPNGDTHNGRPVYEQGDGTHLIVWDGEQWVLIDAPADGEPIDDSNPIYIDGSGPLPLGPWTDPEGGAGPDVVLAEPGEPIYTDGSGPVPWQWPDVHEPTEGEGVCWTTRATTGIISTACLVSPLPHGFRAVIRTDETAAVDDWSSYRALPLFETVTVPPGTMARVGIIGPLASDVPAAKVQLYCEAEL